MASKQTSIFKFYGNVCARNVVIASGKSVEVEKEVKCVLNDLLKNVVKNVNAEKSSSDETFSTQKVNKWRK